MTAIRKAAARFGKLHCERIASDVIGWSVSGPTALPSNSAPLRDESSTRVRATARQRVTCFELGDSRPLAANPIGHRSKARHKQVDGHCAASLGLR